MFSFNGWEYIFGGNEGSFIIWNFKSEAKQSETGFKTWFRKLECTNMRLMLKDVRIDDCNIGNIFVPLVKSSFRMIIKVNEDKMSKHSNDILCSTWQSEMSLLSWLETFGLLESNINYDFNEAKNEAGGAHFDGLYKFFKSNTIKKNSFWFN